MEYQEKRIKEIVEKAMESISAGGSIELEIQKAIHEGIELGKLVKVEGGSDGAKGND